MNNILDKIIADKKNSVERYKKSHPLEEYIHMYIGLNSNHSVFNKGEEMKLNAIVKKTTEEVSNKHFASRNAEKNALAISSNQSQSIDSYESVKKNYEKVLENKENFLRPDYWGGYEFTPHYFEFWQGHESRLNERIIYRKEKNEWSMNYLQP